MKNNEEILELWNSYDSCPDFTPFLDELLAYRKDRDQEIARLKEERDELLGIINSDTSVCKECFKVFRGASNA